MKTLVTSCGRFDLLAETLKSLNTNQKSKIDIIINEDCGDKDCIPHTLGEIKAVHGYFCENGTFIFSEKIGQHKSIEKLIELITGSEASLM